jgi:hypothetical protein
MVAQAPWFSFCRYNLYFKLWNYPCMHHSGLDAAAILYIMHAILVSGLANYTLLFISEEYPTFKEEHVMYGNDFL